VEDSFNARYSAKRKTYEYRLYKSSVILPLKDRFAHKVSETLSTEKLQQALNLFVGEKDFKAFCASGSGAKTTVRTLYSATAKELENGEIVYKNQPTCSTLARDGYAAINNGRCIGKYYNSSEYFIDCGTGIKPTRLIVLNGADYTATSTNAPETKNDADKLFDTMYSTSQSQKEKYFK
jgi:hypothetical protein